MSGPDMLYLPDHDMGPPMSGPDTLYLPHHHMGPPMSTRGTNPITTWAVMSGADMLYLPHHNMAPRCPAQIRCTYSITTWALYVWPRHAVHTPSAVNPPMSVPDPLHDLNTRRAPR